MAEPNVAIALTVPQRVELLNLLDRVNVSRSRRDYVRGQSMPLGWTNFRVGRSIGRNTKEVRANVHLQLLVNKLIKDTYGEDYCWSSLMVNRNTQSEVHTDSYNTGMNIGIIVSRNMPQREGELRGIPDPNNREQSVLLAASGYMVKFDPLMPHVNTPYSGRRGVVRYSIIAFTHRSITRADQYALMELETLGYKPFPTPTPTTIALEVVNGVVANTQLAIEDDTSVYEEDASIYEDAQDYDEAEAVQEKSVKVKGFLARLADKLKRVCCSA